MPATPPREQWHGTPEGYGYGCRCAECVAAKGLTGKLTRQHYQQHPELIPEGIHGKASTYTNYGCRCAECAAEWRRTMQALAKREKDIPPEKHGTRTGYNYYGCRCDRCRAAWAKVYREKRQKARNKKIKEQGR